MFSRNPAWFYEPKSSLRSCFSHGVTSQSAHFDFQFFSERKQSHNCFTTIGKTLHFRWYNSKNKQVQSAQNKYYYERTPRVLIIWSKTSIIMSTGCSTYHFVGQDVTSLHIWLVIPWNSDMQRISDRLVTTIGNGVTFLWPIPSISAHFTTHFE